MKSCWSHLVQVIYQMGGLQRSIELVSSSKKGVFENIIWKVYSFKGELVFENSYSETVEFTSILTNQTWILINIYAPYTMDRKHAFY